MGYTPKTLQNTSGFDDQEPTISISVSDAEWDEAFSKWKAGKNPTDSKEWKQGVFLLTELKRRKPFWRRWLER